MRQTDLAPGICAHLMNTTTQKTPTVNPTTIGHKTQPILVATSPQCSQHYKTVKARCNSVPNVNGPTASAFRRESVSITALVRN
jgi:hypothetical protein